MLFITRRTSFPAPKMLVARRLAVPVKPEDARLFITPKRFAWSAAGRCAEKVVDAPNLKLPVSTDAVANLLAYKPDCWPASRGRFAIVFTVTRAPEMQVVAPAPSVQQQTMRSAPSLSAPSVVAPSPSVLQQAMRSAPSLSSPGVVAPSPAAPKRDLAALQIPGSHVAQVVPPPVSAPERAGGLESETDFAVAAGGRACTIAGHT